jgi:poly-gamma-glutamate synthesis protein (capsule biosynthesis protein)
MFTDETASSSGVARADRVTLFLCGDVMTGRAVDQILPHPNTPDLHEGYVRDARVYVQLAEQASGPIVRPVDYRYIWGDVLAELHRVAPQVRIVNLETSVTSSDTYWPGKPIHYRMHPENVPCLEVAQIDVCALANNHVLDYGYAGLEETLRTLEAAAIQTAGAGRDLDHARSPSIVDLPGGGRVIVWALGSETSGVAADWAATVERPGVDLLDDFSDSTADDILERVQRVKRRGDVVIASIHWGSNWGYEVAPSQIRFAHRLLHGDVDVIHGHSSHHPRPIEVYNGKLVLYGCGELLNDYEGITGYEEFRGHLVLMYFPTIDTRTGVLSELRIVPMQIQRMQVVRASLGDARWLRDVLTLSSRAFGTQVEVASDGSLALLTRAAAIRSPSPR